MSAQFEITQRDLRSRSEEIVDAIEGGRSFVLTRDGRRIGELIPLRCRRRFVPRQEFTSLSQLAPDVDVATFRADQDRAVDAAPDDPYAR